MPLKHFAQKLHKALIINTVCNISEWSGIVESGRNVYAPCKLSAWTTDRFKVVLEVEGHPEYNSEYTLAYQPRTVERKRTTPVMNQ